jgi:hypothetical protein
METDVKTAPTLDLLVLTLLDRKRAKKNLDKRCHRNGLLSSISVKENGYKVHTHKEKALAKHYNLLGPKTSEMLIKTFRTKFQDDYWTWINHMCFRQTGYPLTTWYRASPIFCNSSC